MIIYLECFHALSVLRHTVTSVQYMEYSEARCYLCTVYLMWHLAVLPLRGWRRRKLYFRQSAVFSELCESCEAKALDLHAVTCLWVQDPLQGQDLAPMVVANGVLNHHCWIRWPYLVEARVEGVSNAKEEV